MTPLGSVLLAVAMALPLFALVYWQVDRLADPRYLRGQGVIVVADRILEARGTRIGSYQGCPIWGSVTFLGMSYRFDRVIEARKREAIGPGELYLDPGLVYVTD